MRSLSVREVRLRLQNQMNLRGQCTSVALLDVANGCCISCARGSGHEAGVCRQPRAAESPPSLLPPSLPASFSLAPPCLLPPPSPSLAILFVFSEA